MFLNIENEIRVNLGLESPNGFSDDTIIAQETDNDVYLETANDSVELEASAAEVVATSASIAKLESDAATLESIAMVLEASLEHNAITPSTHALTYVTLESICNSYGLESNVLVTSMEEEGGDAEQATNSMLAKIKNMLANLKTMSAGLLDKIANAVEIVRKDIVKIAGRVKARAVALKSNIKSDNKGGAPVNVSASNLLGAANNGVINGKTFLPALSNSANMIQTITESYTKTDPLKNYIDAVVASVSGKAAPNIKAIEGFTGALSSLCKTRVDDKEGFESYISAPLLNGKYIMKTNYSASEIRSALDWCISKAKSVIKKSEESGTEEPTTESLAISLENDGYTPNPVTLKNILLTLIWFNGWYHISYIIGLHFTGQILFPSAVVGITIGYLLVKWGRKEATILVNHITRSLGLVKKSEEQPATESIEVSMESEGYDDSLVYSIAAYSTVFRVYGNADKKDKAVSVESLSAQEIGKTCDVVANLCDSVIGFVSKTKERKSTISEFVKAAKAANKASGDADAKSGGSSLILVANAHMRDIVNFEVDYIKTIGGFIRASLSYAEASNNVQSA